MSADADLAAEQAVIDHAYRCLAAMRERTAGLDPVAGDWVSEKYLQLTLARRLASLADSGRPLCFGRTDGSAESGGETWYIGRRHVEDAKGEPVVVEWRAPKAAAYYRASPVDPQGLARRRQFLLDGHTVVSISDDRFDGTTNISNHGISDDGTSPDGAYIRGKDALVAELERDRTGEMLDIVATIQPEQDLLIRSPLPGVVAVQGGPGSGKTAVGLHRAAYLIYTYPEVSQAGVLVVGPNRTFLRYIAAVLPSLGEEAVVQTTLPDLVPGVRVKAGPAGEDTPDARRVKGDARMAEVLRRALADRRRPLEDELVVRHSLTNIRIPAAEANAIADALAERGLPWQAARTTLRSQLQRALWLRHREQVGPTASDDPDMVARSAKRDDAFAAALDRLWPSVSPTTLVAELLASPARIAMAADGVLGAEEQAALARPRGWKGWTEADAPLVDEAIHLIKGQPRRYAHVVADEAQDLSPMQLRMLGRRCPSGSLTILGDIAQGTGVWAHDRWEEAIAHLPAPSGSHVEELRLGYRAPAQVLDLASRLLPEIAPELRPTESVRRGRTDPVHVPAAPGAVAKAAAEEAAALSRSGHASVAVVVPGARVAAAKRALASLHIDAGEASHDGLGHAVTVLAAQGAKGLEFDAVVVAAPAEIAAELPGRRGLRLLYIAMTRPTRHLSLVGDLPDQLRVDAV